MRFFIVGSTDMTAHKFESSEEMDGGTGPGRPPSSTSLYSRSITLKIAGCARFCSYSTACIIAGAFHRSRAMLMLQRRIGCEGGCR